MGAKQQKCLFNQCWADILHNPPLPAADIHCSILPQTAAHHTASDHSLFMNIVSDNRTIFIFSVMGLSFSRVASTYGDDRQHCQHQTVVDI